jgi:hypothetical protein
VPPVGLVASTAAEDPPPLPELADDALEPELPEPPPDPAPPEPPPVEPPPFTLAVGEVLRAASSWKIILSLDPEILDGGVTGTAAGNAAARLPPPPAPLPPRRVLPPPNVAEKRPCGNGVVPCATAPV